MHPAIFICLTCRLQWKLALLLVGLSQKAIRYGTFFSLCQISEGDLMAEIETDKATIAMDSPEEGFIAKILVAAGTRDIPVGMVNDLIAQFANYSAADAGGPIPAKATPQKEPISQPAPPVIPAAIPAASPTVSSAPPPPSGKLFPSSPLVKRLAAERGINLNMLSTKLPQGGSGMDGMYVSSDLESLAAQVSEGVTPTTFTAPSASFIDLPLSDMRSVCFYFTYVFCVVICSL
ncbi:unnamed protein product [Protopolystoma xenopodis]|uniref:Peripheral subunit-binding (PSBD) domain-containing protein n=1 Tax=Protopolystoma xenopodis TaxID=117903 RepID=A0A448WAJ3_9PLAT|nr:unnamed protein product [Protopolystoma xenopodis]